VAGKGVCFKAVERVSRKTEGSHKRYADTLPSMIPDYVHPILLKTMETLLREVCHPKGAVMKKVLRFPRVVPSANLPYETQCCWSYSSSNLRDGERSRTQLMPTVNATPDSFSDGGVHSDINTLLSYISSSIAAGATIIDVGGYSTRPGAAFVSVEAEID
jgi:dihydroneopterin aldolase / 2-amino-4-hydroxy-6-hydroxymethyldihydropteridine diphosphokinase / dihydropteroate synthase